MFNLYNIVLIIMSIYPWASGQEEDIEYCKLSNGKPGVCVTYYICQDGKLTWDGVIDIRSKRAVEPITSMNTSSTCKSYLETCCEQEIEPADDQDLKIVTTVPPPPPKFQCMVPAHPAHGRYIVVDHPYAVQGQAFDKILLNITCRTGYRVLGSQPIYCLVGLWFGTKPRCDLFCKLDSNPSVRYICLVSKPIVGTRICNRYEPSGTIVRPECNTPNYYSAYPLLTMRCENGQWNNGVATCVPDCGKVTPVGETLVAGGRRAKRGELPWHAGIYTKTNRPYKQICGGSLVSRTAVISAAHCFWDDVDKQLPTTNYAVAVGKLYRPWDDRNDLDTQKSDVRDIYLSDRFHGGFQNFQDDIAIIVVETAFKLMTHVRPVCLNFDGNFERWQLQPGNKGKVAGWGLTAENGRASPVLKVTELPYVDIEKCYSSSPPSFREYITSDKICAGYTNEDKMSGTALCQGDSGGGLAFPDIEQGKERYYLRGVASTAPSDDNLCNANTVTTFTQILKHEEFIKNHLL